MVEDFTVSIDWNLIRDFNISTVQPQRFRVFLFASKKLKTPTGRSLENLHGHGLAMSVAKAWELAETELRERIAVEMEFAESRKAEATPTKAREKQNAAELAELLGLDL